MPLEEEIDCKAHELVRQLQRGKEIDSDSLSRLAIDELQECLILLSKAYLKLSKENKSAAKKLKTA